MRKIMALLFFAIFSMVSLAQETRRPLRGKVLYRGANVPNENVINATAETATITNDDGEFLIDVKDGDQLVFTAVNYQLEVIKITPEILQKNRLVVEVTEKITELDEVVVTPENQEKFLQIQNEDFKGFEYEIDRGTEVENIALSRTERGMQDGLNIKNIFKLLYKTLTKKKEEEGGGEPLKVSEILRQVYDDEFFVVDLKLPRDKIDAFLYYCDDKVPSQILLRKQNEFQLIDFLVTHSKTYLAELDEE
ncbi:carboxypeptidase-like regulatory domain-containing protein [Flagellimonas onchidii]|uniref:carboxypeptidase-like regulatory domain-containing protein n=1 Tax=Flagellimonas onchidii TaxID=2562684 RepID=UPI0010A5F9D7|nr:carboxypeptidase-like regulatory domain-containing protein [Allomuricauda onchidii]